MRLEAIRNDSPEVQLQIDDTVLDVIEADIEMAEKRTEYSKESLKKLNFIEEEKKRLDLDFIADVGDPKTNFEVAAKWVGERQIYPHHHPELSAILKSMATLRIIKADVLPKGTQIKLSLVLQGGQQVVFKQKRYERDHVIEGTAYEGYDRHNAEIASFHLDRILDYRRAPLVVGRYVNLRTDILPVATQRLNDTFRRKDGRLCYFGKCLYCKEEMMACADSDDVMEGSVTLWLPPKWSKFVKQRHPYQRTYREGKQAQWEYDESYCNKVVKLKHPYDNGTRLLDITDGAAFDYLIGNADRHHYEVFKDKSPKAMMIMLDNAKSFGNPNLHDESILAPLRQCCILRRSTYVRLLEMKDGVLTELLEHAMKKDPIYPILNNLHLAAMNYRLNVLLATIGDCVSYNGEKSVLLETWDGLPKE